MAIISIAGGCSSTSELSISRKERRPSTERVWLVSNRFHTSLAVRAKDAPVSLRDRNPKAALFVIGWGGARLYMLKSVKPWEWITTLVFPTSSALHVIPIRTSLTRECPNSEIIEFPISTQGRDRLFKRLQTAFARDTHGKPRVVGPGKRPTSRFYAGSERYYLPKTCNLWAATGLKTAGIPIDLCPTFMAENLILQGQRHGSTISRHRPPGDPL